MRQALSQPTPIVPGPSRFRVRVQLAIAGRRKSYGWEIYDEEDGRPVRRSTSRFRSSAAAWQAGAAVLAEDDAPAATRAHPGR